MTSSKIAVVTGASGFIGTELTKQLLEKGYEVRGTVRDPKNHLKVAHLLALDAALPGKLTLHAADLLEEESFDEVVEGATYVFHTASPFLMSHEDPIRDLVDPAVKGTKNVLASAAKGKESVQRVVLTSSFAAVAKAKKGPANANGIYDESDWNTDSTVEDGAYRVSKVQAERAAWEAAEKAGLSLVAINPTFVLGPVVSSRTDASSIQIFKAFMEGEDRDMFNWMVDVRDVARAHILAAEVPTASGRYLVSNTHLIFTEDISKALSAAFPDYKFPAGKSGERRQLLDNSKGHRELGLALHPIPEMFVDMARTLYASGIAKPVLR